MTAVLLLLVLLLAHPALADDAAVIRVTGEATVSVAPDEGRIDLGVMTEDANAERAARLNATKLEAVLGAMLMLLKTAKRHGHVCKTLILYSLLFE